ncbi:MAG: rRNA maturation RNase YbeY [Patescibacteria group bacterium]|jgi:probable rRNA maturation factor
MIKAVLFKEVTAPLITEKKQKKVLENFNKLIKAKETMGVNVVIINPQKMREINKRYRQRDKVTDVLSFRYGPETGEVYICYDEVRKTAGGFAELLVHGLLHLVGYDHETNKKDAAKMFNKQQLILNYGN